MAGWGAPSFSQVNGRSAHVAIQVNIGGAGDVSTNTAKVGKAGTMFLSKPRRLLLCGPALGAVARLGAQGRPDAKVPVI